MATMNISLPDSMKAFVDTQVEKQGFSTSSEYVRDLIRRDAGRAHLKALLQEGLDSGDDGPIDDAYFADLRKLAAG